MSSARQPPAWPTNNANANPAAPSPLPSSETRRDSDFSTISSSSSSSSSSASLSLPSRPVRSRSKQPRPFVFVNVAGDQKTSYRRQLRSHVQLVVHDGKRRNRETGKSRGRDEDEGQQQQQQQQQQPQQQRRRRPRTALQRQIAVWSVGAGRSDPFDSLPVEDSIHLDRTIKYFFTYYLGASLLAEEKVVYGNITLWDLLRQEQSSLLVLLSGTSIVHEMNAGVGISRASLSYMGQAIETVRKNMPALGESVTSDQISESFVAAVASLAAITSLAGDFAAVNSHLHGMYALIAARGGIDTFSKYTQHTLFCCEMHGCAGQVRMPTLRPTCLPFNPSFPLGFTRTVKGFHAATIAHLPSLADTPVDSLLYQLHEISLALMPPWSTIVDRRTVRSLTDVAWYDLMGVLVKLKSSHEWAKHAFTLHSDNDCANTRTRAQAASPPPAPGDLVYAAIAQTAHLYIWGVLSDLKYDTASKGHFSRQLRALLSVPDLLERWTAAGARLPSLAWTLGVGWFVASGHHGDPSLPKWFEGRLAVVVPEMVRMQLVTGGPGIEVLMGEFPSTDVFWKEMWRLAERWGAMRESAV